MGKIDRNDNIYIKLMCNLMYCYGFDMWKGLCGGEDDGI